MKWTKNKQLAGYLLDRCVALAPSLTFLGGFMEQSVWVSLCWLASTEESSCGYGCTTHQLRTLRKHLGRRSWGDYWCFLTSSSTCSQSSNSCLTVWVKVPPGLRVCLNWATFRAKALQIIITLKYLELVWFIRRHCYFDVEITLCLMFLLRISDEKASQKICRNSLKIKV